MILHYEKRWTPQVYSKRELWRQAGSRYNKFGRRCQARSRIELISERARNSSTFTNFVHKNVPTASDCKYGLVLTAFLSVIRLHCKWWSDESFELPQRLTESSVGFSWIAVEFVPGLRDGARGVRTWFMPQKKGKYQKKARSWKGILTLITDTRDPRGHWNNYLANMTECGRIFYDKTDRLMDWKWKNPNMGYIGADWGHLGVVF